MKSNEHLEKKSRRVGIAHHDQGSRYIRFIPANPDRSPIAGQDAIARERGRVVSIKVLDVSERLPLPLLLKLIGR
jgi:hypothetical protein